MGIPRSTGFREVPGIQDEPLLPDRVYPDSGDAAEAGREGSSEPDLEHPTIR
jgi:hypothetical protein